MEDCSSDGSTSFFTPKMPYELQSGVDTGSWSRNEIEGNVARLANETDEISSSAIRREPLESLNDVQIRGADSNAKTGGVKSEPTPTERQRKTKQRKRSETNRGKKRRDKKVYMFKLLEGARRKKDEMIVEAEHLREVNQMIKELFVVLDRIIVELETTRSEEEVGSMRSVHRQQLMLKSSVLHNLGTSSESVEKDQHGTYFENVDKFPSMELATARSVSNGNVCNANILVKLEDDDESKVKLSDFADLGGERIPVGKYSFPLSLQQTVKNITEVHGDVSATTKMNSSIAEGIYVMFCASIKEMSALLLEQVTEDLIFKWRDAIRDALRIDFKVVFAMEHLKKVARAYIGLMERLKLNSMTSKISDLEAQLSAVKAEHSKISETSKEYMDAAEEFIGKAVSWGMF